MDNKKYEQLIDLIINEQEDKARELFHEIVVEKSREIYENIMDEEMSMEAGHEDKMVGEVGDLANEIAAEESGGVTEEDDLEVIDLDSEEEVDADDHHADVGGEEELEDRVVELEDKLDELMAEFEALMGGDDDMGDAGDEVDGEEMMEASDDEEEAVEESKDEEDHDKEKVEEAVQLKKVPGLYNSKIGGDNGSNTKSPALTSPKVKTAGVNPVKFSGDAETVPTSPKAPSNYGTKGEKDVEGAGKFKNVPGQDNFKEKGDSAPKPVTSQASGVNNKSPVAKG